MGEGKERERGTRGRAERDGKEPSKCRNEHSEGGKKGGQGHGAEEGRGGGRKRSNFSFWLRQMPPPLSAAVARSPPLPPTHRGATASVEG